MMERRALNPSTYSRPCAPARLGPERQCVGRLASLLICHGWTGSETLTLFFISVGLVILPRSLSPSLTP
ncbi:hypothetical protein CesoFtcFv8_027781 [Champsocephalus esox]|uniref:Uncharacterized protein n=2 Tax=Champsocephalus esox TaxID=159716 RepID=A0AAN8AZ19_9TELE|nr:hypothetical protein CesoFtcFv8_027781 [Champsocephalus esox]